MTATIAAAAALLGAAAPGHAVPLSFNGTLAADNAVLVYAFTTLGSGSVTIETFSYAGGTTFDGRSIAAGGFDPVFSLFTAGGALVDTGDDGATRIDPTSKSAFDATLTLNLAAGSYFIAVTQWDNYAVGPLFSNGFVESATPNFTAAYGCSAGRFCDVNGFSRSANLVIGVTGAQVSAVPEPDALALMLLGLPAIGALRRRQLRRAAADAA